MMEKWMDRFDLPDEPGLVRSIVEIMGYERVLIEHHCGVTAYGRKQICVKVNFGKISITGEDLELKRMSKGQLIICGCIRCVTLERAGRLC